MAKEATAFKTDDPNDTFMMEDVGIEYFFNKNVYHRVYCGYEKDKVSGRYRLETGKPLKQFDTAMGKAYAVTDLQTQKQDSHYALVLDKRYPVRLEEMNRLLNSHQEGFANIAAMQILQTSVGTGRSFVIVVSRPEGIPLSEYLKRHGPLSEDAVIRHIITPVHDIIQYLYKKKVVHGHINLDTVYINEHGKIYVSECFSQPSGYSQPIIYESLSRATCIPMGKGIGLYGATDYHALGVLVAILLRGRNPFENMTDVEILEYKFIENTYKKLTEGMELSERILDFLRGVLNDKSKEIWVPSYVDDWIKGRKFNLLPPAENIDAGRPILFNGKKYWNKKYLAFGLAQNWSDAKLFLREDSLRRWIERSVQDADLAEKMEIYLHRAGGGSEPGSSFDREDELLAQYLLLLDKDGPLRLREFSAMPDGIPLMLSDAYTSGNAEIMSCTRYILSHGLVTYVELDKPGEGEPTSPQADAIFIIQRSVDFFRKKDLGFGLERCLYELNPSLACQSVLLQDEVVYALPDLMHILNADAKKEHGKQLVDVHLAAFVSMRLELHVRMRLPALSKFPDLIGNPNIQMAALLSLAQQTCGIDSLPNLAKKVVVNLEKVIESFHSRFIREEVTEKLNKSAEKGVIPMILKLISNTEYIVRDRLGFRRAVKLFKNNTIQILRLNNRTAVNNMAYRYGLQLSVIISFFFAAIVLVVLIMKAF